MSAWVLAAFLVAAAPEKPDPMKAAIEKTLTASALKMDGCTDRHL